MSRITLFMLPEPGHLLPTFRLAMKLKQRGHQICYVSFPELRNEIKSLGFGFIPMLERFSRGCINNGHMLETLQAGSHVYQGLKPQLRREWSAVIAEIFSDIMRPGADLLILDSGLSMLDGALGGYGEDPAPVSTALQRLTCSLLRVSPVLSETYDSVRTFTFFRKIPELILCPKEFNLPLARKLAYDQHYVEPSVFVNRPRIGFPWDWIDTKKKLVYCSFGSQSQAYPESHLLLRQIVKVFEDLRSIQLVLATGAHLDPADFGDVPCNILIRRIVPQLDLLNFASGIITHGGLGTIKEAILAAVPLIVTPFDFDQPLNAQRVIHHGMGCIMHHTPLPSVANISDMILSVIHNNDIKARITGMQSIFQKIEESTPSVTYIEAAMAGKVMASCSPSSCA